MVVSRSTESELSNVHQRLDPLTRQIEQMMQSRMPRTSSEISNNGAKSSNMVLKTTGKELALSAFFNSQIVVDSGVTYHMFAKKSLLSETNSKKHYHHVTIVNGLTVPID
jgi:hypothetical protein